MRSEQEPPRRRYDSPVRRERTARTRRRIVEAGSELAHELSSWDWRALTFRAVAQRAEVGLTTIYRHFPTQQHLHDAVMQRLNEEADVDYDDVELGSVAPLAGRLFASLSAFAAAPVINAPDDPTFRAMDERRRAAFLRAVEREAPGWTVHQRESAAAMLDVLINLPTYERLLRGWDMDPSRAAATVTWVLDRLVAAIQDGSAPPPA